MKWDKTIGRPEPVKALDRIAERENGEPLVAILDFAPSVLLQRKTVIPYVRRSVAEMLEQVGQSLPMGIKLGVWDAWRPIERQQRIYDFMTAMYLEVHPDTPHAKLKRTINRWVAPTDRKAPPGHCTGAAIDVTLIGPDGEDLDMTSPYSLQHDRLNVAPTFSFGITDQARTNRMMLYESMVGVGFSNCRDEWWHYSYGDAGWAVRLDRTECIYGLARLDPALYAQQEADWIAALNSRVNPFRSLGAAAKT